MGPRCAGAAPATPLHGPSRAALPAAPPRRRTRSVTKACRLCGVLSCSSTERACPNGALQAPSSRRARRTASLGTGAGREPAGFHSRAPPPTPTVGQGLVRKVFVWPLRGRGRTPGDQAGLGGACTCCFGLDLKW